MNYVQLLLCQSKNIEYDVFFLIYLSAKGDRA